MAEVKITALPAYSDPVSTDVLPIVDVTADLTKKVSITDLLKNAAAGTAAAPAFAFDADPDTGMYRSGADALAFSTGGTGRLFIDSSGKVSISSQNSATIPLRIYSSSNDGDAIEFVGRTTNGKNQLQFYAADGTTEQVQITSTDDSLRIRNRLNTYTSFWTNDTERLRIKSDGKVGIGTTSPGRLLHLAKTSGNPDMRFSGATSTTGLEFVLEDSSGIGFITARETSGQLVLRTGGLNERMRIDSSGRLGVGTSSPATDFHLYKNSGGNSTSARIENAATGQAQLQIIAGTGSTNRASRIDFYNGVNSTTIPRWTLINDYNQLGANDFRFASAANASALTITQAGNVGIGTTSPGYVLDCGGASQGTPTINCFGPSIDNNWAGGIRFASNNGTTVTAGIQASVNGMWFSYGGSERVRIDSSGRLLVGTSSSLDTGGVFQVNSDTSGIIHYYEGNNNTPVRLRLTKSRGETTAAASGDGLGEITFRGRSTGNSLRTGASIAGEVDSAPGATSVPGRLVFSTTADGASSPTERMRISSDGATTLTKTGDNVANSAALTVGQSNYATNNAAGPQYGIKVDQLGARYTLQIGVGAEIKNTYGYYGSTSFDHFTKLRGIGVYGYSPSSTAAYQQSIGVYGKAVGASQNYNSVYGVAGRANLGETGFINDNTDFQAGYGGHFVSFGKANSIGVYADAYLDASPGAGTHASPLVCATNGSEILRVTSDKYLRLASGSNGIQFNGDTAAANALDDYEEGTWTPQFTDGTNNATMATGNIGKYTKIGNTVHAQCDARCSALGSMTGDVRLSGLPFPGVSLHQPAATVGGALGLAITAGQSVSAYIPGASSYLFITLFDSTTGASILQATELTDDGRLFLNVTYQVS